MSLPTRIVQTVDIGNIADPQIEQSVILALAPDGYSRLIGPITVNAVDLLAGPVTKYTPAAGEVVIRAVPGLPFVATDGGTTITVVQGGVTRANLVAAPTTIETPATGPVAASLGGAPWVALHAYTADDAVFAAGQSWYPDGAGTSGASEPDFAGNIGGSVVDNDLTWNDNVALPTLGTATFYLLVASPAAP